MEFLPIVTSVQQIAHSCLGHIINSKCLCQNKLRNGNYMFSLELLLIMHLLQYSADKNGMITLRDIRSLKNCAARMLSGDACRSDLLRGLANTNIDRDNNVSIC